jgi:8-amino-7-oxononanoate synthase
MSGKLDFIQQEMAALREQGLLVQPRVIDSPQGAWIAVDGKKVLNLCSNNYLGFANHDVLKRRSQKAIEAFGVGPAAVRSIAGTLTLHRELEAKLARFKGVEATLTFQSGFCANLAALGSLAGPEDVILSDELNHASIIDGSRLSRARVVRYTHCDPQDLREKLRGESQARRRIVVTDGVFSMDGDIAPLAPLAELARHAQAWFVVDDAHGIGVVGPDGRGSVAAAGLDADAVPLLVGTLGKAFGSFGAFVAGPRELLDFLVQRARSYIYTTALPPPVAAASRAALRIVREEPWRRERLQMLIARFRAGAQVLGLPLMPSTTPIQPLLLEDSARCLAASQRLRERGFWVAAIRPPTVPQHTARLRVTLSAAHQESEVDALLGALAEVLQQRAA